MSPSLYDDPCKVTEYYNLINWYLLGAVRRKQRERGEPGLDEAHRNETIGSLICLDTELRRFEGRILSKTRRPGLKARSCTANNMLQINP